MKYDMLGKEIVKRVIDTFDSHDEARNEKYEQIKKKDNYWSSDRDRFVGRFFKEYVGKNFILMDKEIIAYHDAVDECGFSSTCEPMSLYSREYRDNSYHFWGVPVYRNSKKFLHVTYIHAVNQMYGRGYIEMACQDILDRRFNYVLDYNTLAKMQFREISDEEFDRMMRELQDLERQYPELASPLSPTKRVGGEVNKTFRQVQHRFPMLSLGNTYSIEEIEDFAARTRKLLDGTPFTYTCELKYDGVSIGLTYRHGQLVQAVTRGND